MARVRSSVTAYQPRPTRARPGGARVARAKLFANGRSQAVRLPKEFRLPGSEVCIHREGDRIIREPLPADPVDWYGWPIDFWDGLRQRAKVVAFPDVEPMGVRFLDPADLSR